MARPPGDARTMPPSTCRWRLRENSPQAAQRLAGADAERPRGLCQLGEGRDDPQDGEQQRPHQPPSPRAQARRRFADLACRASFRRKQRALAQNRSGDAIVLPTGTAAAMHHERPPSHRCQAQ
jgi:hypothetical protein